MKRALLTIVAATVLALSGAVGAGASVVSASVESDGRTFELDVEVARRPWSG